MFIVSRTFRITKGSASLLLERLNNDTQLTMAKGLISRSILLSQKVAEEEKVVVQLLWESKEAYIAFETSPEHVAYHKAMPPRPPYILSVTVENFTLVNEKKYCE
jgi:heme oxygenase (staphylobilin-producing)